MNYINRNKDCIFFHHYVLNFSKIKNSRSISKTATIQWHLLFDTLYTIYTPEDGDVGTLILRKEKLFMFVIKFWFKTYCIIDVKIQVQVWSRRKDISCFSRLKFVSLYKMLMIIETRICRDNSTDIEVLNYSLLFSVVAFLNILLFTNVITNWPRVAHNLFP